MGVEIHDGVVFGVEKFYVFVVLNEDYVFFEDLAEREEVVLIAEIFHYLHLFFRQIKALELLNSTFLVLHPQNPGPIKIKRHINFRNLELSISLKLILSYIDLIQIIFFLLQFRS